MATNYNKAPPAFSKDVNYEKWCKKLKIWQSLTSLEAKKQGPALFLALDEDSQEAVLDLDHKEIACDNGIANIIACLNKLYLKDKTQSAFQALEAFEEYRRPKELSMRDYCNHFDKLYSKTKSYGTTVSSDVLGFRLLKSANLTTQQEQLVKATIGDLTYDNMKAQLKKIHGQDVDSASAHSIKTEGAVKVEDEEEVLYGSGFQAYHGGYRGRGRAPAGQYYQADRGRNSRRGHRGGSGYQQKRGTNPLDQFGNVSTCIECGSINHWVNKCPDREKSKVQGTYQQEYEYDQGEDDDSETHYQVTLFQADYDEPGRLKTLISESMNSAVLDCGASKTVCGDVWFKCYYESLDDTDKSKVNSRASQNIFKFGDGNRVSSTKLVKIPAKIGNLNIMINTDVIEKDIPLLLSKESLKKARAELNFKEDTAMILGQKVDLHVTTSGHYTIPLSKNQHIISEVEKNPNTRITLACSKDMSKDAMALKLHRQFAHPPPEKLLKLLKCAGHFDKELVDCITKVSSDCCICKEYRKPPPRPVVGLPMATTFGECVAMDLKKFGDVQLLHLVDHATRLSACSVIRSKKPDVIIREIFKIWISIYGCPEKFLSDNGGEFSNEPFRELCEKVNITVKTTSAESPWSNGLCERHNQVLGEMLTKTMSEAFCSLDLAVAWCINAKNSLQNVHGYSPYQLVFGKNPRLPGILTDKPPAMGDVTSTKIIRDNLNALHTARQAFIKSECSEKLRRALSHNVRTSGDIKYVTGDKVYYKRLAHKRWPGPAVFLGQDGQQVLVKHGGIYVRVHPCRLSLEKPCYRSVPRDDSIVGSKAQTVDSHGTGDAASGNKATNTDEEDTDEDYTKEDNHEGDDAEQDDTEDDNHEDDAEEDNTEEDNSEEDESKEDDAKEDNTEENTDDNTGENIKDNTTDSAAVRVKVPQTLPVNRRGRPPKRTKLTKATKDTNDQLKKNMTIEYQHNGSEDWIKSRLVSKSGKSTGKYKNEWNIINRNRQNQVLDFDRDVAQWRMCYSQEPESEVQLSEIFQTEMLQDSAEAKIKELQSWKTNKVYEEVKNTGQACISVRWIVRPKIIDGKLKTKARLCARGFEETCDFRTDSPTCMRESVRIVLCIITSKSWILHSIDYKTAFLQGKPIERDLYIKPPKEANTSMIWKLRKTVYGLADAPRVWYLRLKEELLKLGAKVSTYDQGVFFWHSEAGLEGILVSFVDDQLWGGTPKFEKCVIQKLRSTFIINYEHTRAFKYIGIDILQHTDHTISINQESYIKSVQPVFIDKHRQLQKEDNLTTDERGQFRCINGQLSWIAGISRPDASFNVCNLSSSLANAKVSHLLLANKTLKHIKNNYSRIHIPKFDGLENLQLTVYTDASYANLPDGGSQGGQIVFLTSGNVSCPIAWKSTKVKRVVKSTLAAETLAFVEGCDVAFLMAKLIAEIVNNDRNSTLPITCKTDNKSLFDAANTCKTISDIRLRVEMSIVREMLDRGEIKLSWIKSTDQLADVLTKSGASSSPLLEVIEKGTLC